MQRERFTKVVEEVLDSLPEEFRTRIHNVAVLVEDLPPNQRLSTLDDDGSFWVCFMVCQGHRRAFLICVQTRTTSCFTRRTSRRSVLTMPKFVIKSGEP